MLDSRLLLPAATLCCVLILVRTSFSQTTAVQFLGQSPFTAYVSRASPPGHPIYRFVAINSTDRSANGISYTLVQGSQSLFQIHTETGQLANLEYLPLKSFPLTVEAELNSKITTAELTVRVLPEYTTTPRFEHTSFHFATSEYTPVGTPFAVIQAFSLDPQTTVQGYSIARGNTDSDLAINATTGVLLVAHELDRERTPSYNLYICYKESGAEIEVSVDVSVSDENDNSPEFSQLLYEARVSELNPPDTTVVSVSAADRDTGENGMVGYRLDSEVDMFAIDESSGEVVLAGNLNHEQQSMYTFTVVAEDRGQPAQTSTAVVVVAVTNEDDECPQFDSQNYAAIVPSSLVMQDMELLTVHAVDPDSTSGVMYAIVSGNELQALNLDPGTGLITLSSTAPNSYVLNITATGDGVCADQSTVRAEISIAATNEHSPQFQGPCVGEIEENVPTETLVTTLSALDDDTGVYGQISYTFIEDSQLFRVDPATGEIYTTGELDHEQTAYHLIGATATDGGNRQTYCLLNITVLDVNDHHPSFLAQDGYTIMLHLNSPPGAFVLQTLAEDPDTGMNGAIVYSLSDPAGIFNIDYSNGRITTAASIATMSYSLAVEASDMGDPPQTSSISVNVIVVNDSNVPAFNQSVYSMTICENLPFLTDVLQVHSRTSNGILYQLLSGSEYYTNGDGVFSIDTEGQISVTSQGVIDFERLPQSQFQFSVSAQNTLGMISGMAAIVIDVLDQDDNGPIFPSPDIEASISENMPEGTLVTQLAAVDPDSGTNGEVTYSVSLGEDKFQVTSSGEVLSLMPFDAESTQLNILRIVASNPNPVNNVDPCPVPSRQSATVVIRVSILDVNDNPPTIETTGSLTLPENTAVGTTVHTFSATDPDSSDNGLLIYTITGGNTDHSFQIDNTGALSLLQALDYERMSEYTLTVQVSDGSHTGTTSLDISVTDVDDEPPVFDQAMYTGGVIENAPIGTSILQVSAEDVDTPSVRYWLTGPAVGRLSIGSGGEVAVAGNVDREEFPNGIMSFLAVAEGGGLTTTNITINISDVNDYTPHFTDVEVGSVLENTEPGPSGIPVTTVQAIDLDSGANGAVTYMLVQGEEDGFQIDPNTGEITAHDVYDREETPSYTLLVEAVDSGAEVQLSSTTVVQVLIGDVDDNTPYLPFTYIFARVFENAAVGTEVIRIPAIDLDEGDNAIITYTYISSSPEEMKYSIDSTTGTVMVNGNLDYENPLHRVFNLTFSLADSPTPAELEIHLLDENDNTPVLTMSEMPLGSFLSENTPVGTLVLMITATDEDTGTNAEIVFSILNGDPSRDFQIMFGNSVASISTARQLDYETTSSYDIIIEACDLGTPQRCSTKEVDLSIANVNDVSPSFSETPYTASIVENTSPVASILQVSATDTDFGSNFVYGIESGNSNGYFALNSSSGVLSSTVPLDREEQDTYVLVVTAVDSGTSPLTGTGTVIISVTDVNDNPSSESMSWIEMVLLDGQLQAGMLGPVFFSDPDSTYTFTGCSVVEIENAASLFSVDQDNCTLSLEQSNPPEGTYSLGISGNDGQNPAVVSRVNINIIHLSSSDIPLDSLVTISLAMSAADYLSNTYTSFPTALSDVLGTDRDLLTIISVQPGYQDPDTVDVSFTVRTSDGSYLDPTYVLQALFTHRDSLASSGYILSALPADPCSSEPCFNEANCKPRTAITGSSMTAESSQFALISPVVQLDYECQCVPGTSGKDCSINYDDCYSSPCLYGAECVDGVNGFQCDCPLGTTGPDCSGTPDECSSTPCQNGATCENTPGSHTCHCVPGYYGPECQYHYFRAAPTCASSPCQNGATCSSGWDTFTCLCPDGYSGQLCDQPVVVQGGCTGNPCYNGSTCSESLSGPVCTCSVGFTGPLCRWPVDSCELEPCQNEGTCATGLYSSYQCYCPLPYTGQDCGEVIPGCESSPCQNGGRCSDAGGGGYSCECTRGFYGDNCEYSVQPQNLCSGSPCLSGNCTYGRDAYTCTCTSGHSGAQCEHASPLLTACDSNPCQHGSTCEGGAVDYTCLCSSGFTGPNCEININDCGPSQCQHGTCQDGINGLLCECDSEQITGYHCEVYCPDGHSGSFCETSTLLCNTDPSPCQNGGTCLEGGSSYSCVCPPGRTGSTCELESSCDVVECHNGEVCSALPGGGYGCECPDGFQGPNCELVTLSFTSASSYRTYQSLELRGQGSIQFEFNTLDSEGLLLYNTQLQAGTSRDYIAAEVSGGQLVVGVSRGGNRAVATATSSAVAVSDGQWHRVTIETSGKQVSVLLDFCHELDESVRATAGCSSTAVTPGEDSFLDLGLPLWLGGVPFTPGPSLPVSSQGITACIRDVYISGRLLDLNSHVDEQGTQHGCPQLDDKCASGQCGSGQCVPTWNTFLCVCPLLVTGNQCDDAASSLSYSGSGYARYTLTEEGLRQRRQSEEGLRSTYHDQVSLSLRTTHSEGALFYMRDESGAEFLYLQLESGEVGLHLDLGSGQESVFASGHHLNDSQRHNVSVTRSGLDVTLTVDSYTTQYTLSSSELTLEIDSAEIYTGGSPYTSSGFTGCLQDVRLNQFSLPTSGSNRFASVTIEGGTGVIEGCSLGPCFPHPCGSGLCEETSDTGYECVCPDGSRRLSECPDTVQQSDNLAYIVGGSVLGFLLVLSLVTISAGVLWRQRRRKRRTYLIGTESKAGSQELAEIFTPSQALVISNEEGGGEADTVVADWTPLTSKRKSISQASPASSRSSSKAKKTKPPPVEKEEVDGTDVRSNSPVIRAYLQERVDAAAADIKSVDSVREYCEEGSESENESLSSIMSGLSEGEEYTLAMLRAAGPQLSSLAPLLEHVLNEGESVRDSSSEALHTTQ